MESNKAAQKLEKKLRKHRHVVSKETGVVCSLQPTKNLALCNVGQVNGLTEEAILQAFKRHGSIERVLLVPGKSCSFVTFKCLASAVDALEANNGRLNLAQDRKPLFLTYVEALPEVKDEKIWNQLPPGLIIFPNFITELEESQLINLCKFDEEAGMKHRQVKHYGYEFRYDINNVDKDKPLTEKIPKECDFLWERLPIKRFVPDQLTVNHYKPGQGIPPHVDTHSAFEDPILSLSLGSPVVMEFKKHQTICVLLPRRSLAVIGGESRYDWTHGIIPRKFDCFVTENGYNSFERGTRVSFTFRKVLKGECQCVYKSNCDSFTSKLAETKIEDSIAAQLENQHVHEVYEDIASHFSSTRHKPWPNVLDFVQSFDPGSILVDVGCGNGKYLGLNSNIFEIGVDRSFKLIELCKERGFEAFTSNCLNLPLRNAVADGAISIAVIHHLATEERRLQAVREIVRVLRIGGRALIYVWAKDQIKDSKKSSYLKQDRKQRKTSDSAVVQSGQVCVGGVSLPVHTNRTDFNHSDMLVPWKLKSDIQEEERQTFLRFYHVFQSGELDALCGKVSGASVVKSYYDQGNYCVILKKIE